MIDNRVLATNVAIPQEIILHPEVGADLEVFSGLGNICILAWGKFFTVPQGLLKSASIIYNFHLRQRTEVKAKTQSFIYSKDGN